MLSIHKNDMWNPEHANACTCIFEQLAFGCTNGRIYIQRTGYSAGLNQCSLLTPTEPFTPVEKLVPNVQIDFQWLILAQMILSSAHTKENVFVHAKLHAHKWRLEWSPCENLAPQWWTRFSADVNWCSSSGIYGVMAIYTNWGSGLMYLLFLLT